MGTLTAPDMLRTVRKVEARGAFAPASRLLGYMVAICAFAVGGGGDSERRSRAGRTA